MATGTKICKVCGEEYEYCHTARRITGIFRWQDVACCPKHGAEYLAKIRESRENADSENEYAESETATEASSVNLVDENEASDSEDSSEENSEDT